MTTDDRLKEIAIEQGEAIEVTHSDDEIGNYHYVYSFELNELRAFINAVHVEEYEQTKVNAEYIKRLEDVAKHFDEVMAWELGVEPIPSLSIAVRALYKSVLASRPKNLG